MWCDVMWCDVMWCDVMWCDVRWGEVRWVEVRFEVVRCEVWGEVKWDVRWGVRFEMRCEVKWGITMRWGVTTQPTDQSELTQGVRLSDHTSKSLGWRTIQSLHCGGRRLRSNLIDKVVTGLTNTFLPCHRKLQTLYFIFDGDFILLVETDEIMK